MSLGEFAIILPESALVVAASAVLMVDLFVRKETKPNLVFLGLIGVIAAGAALIPAQSLSGEVLWGMLVADGFTTFFKVVFLAIALLVLLASPDYVVKRGIAPGEFYALMLFATVGLIFMASSADVVPLYLGLELTSISTYVLAGMMREDAASGEASIKYFLNGTAASAILLFGLSLLYGLTGTTSLAGIMSALVNGNFPAIILIPTLVFVVAGFGFKLALVPFHSWAPDTYQGAPTPVTSFLSVGSKGAAFAAVLRLFLLGLTPVEANWTLAFAVLAVLTMTIANVSALWQTDIKRMMAYSSITQAGYILVGLAIASQASITAILFYLLVYAFMNTGAFAVVIAVSNRIGSDEIQDYAGLARRAPLLAASLVIFFLGLIGIPPTGGFYAKFFLMETAIQGGMTWLAIAIALNSVISVGYYWGVVRRMYLDEARGDAAVVASPALSTAVFISVVLTLALGLVPQAFFQWATWSAVLPIF